MVQSWEVWRGKTGGGGTFVIVPALYQDHSAKLSLKVMIYRGTELFISGCDNKGTYKTL
jgi:hypothetical protein